MITNDSIKLAEFWVALNTLKIQLDNEILPIAGYLGIGDEDLTMALVELSAKIQHHFEKFRLVVGTRK